jgi:hypothetical protein
MVLVIRYHKENLPPVLRLKAGFEIGEKKIIVMNLHDLSDLF